MAVIVGSYVALAWWLADATRRSRAASFGTALGVGLLAHEAVNVALHLGVFGYAWYENLPLNFCRAGMFLSAWLLVRRSYRAYEIAYFWAIVGSTTALLAPALAEGFPHPLFFTFFLGHGLAIFAVLFATWAFGFAPRLRSIGVSFLAAVMLAAVAWPVNRVFGTNYLYLMARPEGAEWLQVFEPWPGYLVGVVFCGIVGAFVAYLPFALRRAAS